MVARPNFIVSYRVYSVRYSMVAIHGSCKMALKSWLMPWSLLASNNGRTILHIVADMSCLTNSVSLGEASIICRHVLSPLSHVGAALIPVTGQSGSAADD
jgi:hypothetical protein